MTVIDRFEGEYAVLETENGMITLLRSELPEGAAEGDILLYRNGSYTADKTAAAKKRRQTRARLRRLIKGDKQ